MNIDTKYHGTVAVKGEDIIRFPHGLPGFADEKRFVILPFADTPFVILQSTETPVLGFVLIEPFSYFPTYEIDLDDKTLEQLQITGEQDVALYVILTVAEPFDDTTANLQAPIVINVNKRLGKQVILTNTNYKTKHRLFPEKVAK
ncbi:flagellar assembly protein FliW [Geobacillus stearothermophilus]|uniref:flagellar assembly protein FliW n=1 Tax=Geobacillus stearothermophilus TaxID=1422 RepID=UPI003D1BDF63